MLNAEQKITYDILMSGRNAFVTGDAGTGKSYVINKFIEDCEKARLNIMVCAPTGVASINVGGVTIHRAFKVPVKPLVEPPKNVPKVVQNTDVIVIDEISMCRIDLFEYIAKIIIAVNLNRRKKKTKKDIQVVVVGDFYQLPPVMNDRDKEILSEYYGVDLKTSFAFKSKYWNMFNFVPCVLKDSMRQSDSDFKKLLNQARVGDRICLERIRRYSCKEQIKDAITICGTNKAVKDINERELNKLKSATKVFVACETGEPINAADKMVDDNLVLKIGARVMTVINDSEDKYQNGSLGTVKDFVDTSSVVVELDNGYTVKIEMHTWEIEDYALVKNEKTGDFELKKEVISTYSQIPLRIAYAVTVHKSQGQTYDAVNLNPYCWDYGQLYTALSRVRTLNKLFLTSYLSPKYLVTSLEVTRFYNSLIG